MSYRCYHLANMYLAGIQAGIQSAHAQHVLAQKYAFPIIDGKQPSPAFKPYREWAENHQTIICLNAGYAANLESVVDILDSENNPMAWVEWHESEEALNGAITNVAVVLPERIYANNQAAGKASASIIYGPDIDKNKNSFKVKTGRGDEELVLFRSKNGFSSILMNREHGDIMEKFTECETHLMAALSGMRLMN